MNIYLFLAWLLQEREEAEALWAADGQSVLKKDEEETERNANPGRNARNHAPKERGRGRERVTGGKDELWEPKNRLKLEFILTDICCYFENLFVILFIYKFTVFWLVFNV